MEIALAVVLMMDSGWIWWDQLQLLAMRENSSMDRNCVSRHSEFWILCTSSTTMNHFMAKSLLLDSSFLGKHNACFLMLYSIEKKWMEYSCLARLMH
jgi:hypothetical protein